MNKKIIICCDGTWQSLNSEEPTNVVKLSQACKLTALDGTSQLLYYQEGIGSNNTFEDKFLGGAFGRDIDQNIQDAYRFLCLNYVEGDQV